MAQHVVAADWFHRCAANDTCSAAVSDLHQARVVAQLDMMQMDGSAPWHVDVLRSDLESMTISLEIHCFILFWNLQSTRNLCSVWSINFGRPTIHTLSFVRCLPYHKFQVAVRFVNLQPGSNDRPCWLVHHLLCIIVGSVKHAMATFGAKLCKIILPILNGTKSRVVIRLPIIRWQHTDGFGEN